MQHHATLEPLRLDTIHPDLNSQIEQALTDIVEKFHDESPRLDKEIRKAQITVTVDIAYTLETRAVEIVASTKVKLPGYRAVAQRFARLPHGGARILVEQDDAADQLTFHRTSKDPQ